MKARSFIPSLVLAALAGCAGYLCRNLQPDEPNRLQAQEMAPLDAFVSVHSFSEVETVKGVLQALCSRYLLEAQQQRFQESFEAATHSRGGANTPIKPSFARAIPVLERGIQEFRNTEQELLLTQDLLLVLAHEGLEREWLDLYLNTLYRQPTADMVGRFAQPAVEVGRALGRSDEVFAAFRYLSMIPFEFAAKRQVGRAQEGTHLAATSHEPPGGGEAALGL